MIKINHTWHFWLHFLDEKVASCFLAVSWIILHSANFLLKVFEHRRWFKIFRVQQKMYFWGTVHQEFNKAVVWNEVFFGSKLPSLRSPTHHQIKSQQLQGQDHPHRSSSSTQGQGQPSSFANSFEKFKWLSEYAPFYLLKGLSPSSAITITVGIEAKIDRWNRSKSYNFMINWRRNPGLVELMIYTRPCSRRKPQHITQTLALLPQTTLYPVTSILNLRYHVRIIRVVGLNNFKSK